MNTQQNKKVRLIFCLFILITVVTGMRTTLVRADGETPTPEPQVTVEVGEVSFDGVPEGQNALISANPDGTINVTFNFTEELEDEAFSYEIRRGDEVIIIATATVENGTSTVVLPAFTDGSYRLEFDNELEIDHSETEVDFRVRTESNTPVVPPTEISPTIESPTAPSSTPIGSPMPSPTPASPTNTPTNTPSGGTGSTPTTTPTDTPNITPSAPKTGMVMETNIGLDLNQKTGAMILPDGTKVLLVVVDNPSEAPLPGTCNIYTHTDENEVKTTTINCHLNYLDTSGRVQQDIGRAFYALTSGTIYINDAPYVVGDKLTVENENWWPTVYGQITLTTCQVGSWSDEEGGYTQRLVVELN